MQKPDTGKLIVYINGEPVECTPKDGTFVPDPDIQITCTEDAGSFTVTFQPLESWYYKILDKHLYQ